MTAEGRQYFLRTHCPMHALSTLPALTHWTLSSTPKGNLIIYTLWVRSTYHVAEMGLEPCNLIPRLRHSTPRQASKECEMGRLESWPSASYCATWDKPLPFYGLIFSQGTLRCWVVWSLGPPSPLLLCPLTEVGVHQHINVKNFRINQVCLEHLAREASYGITTGTSTEDSAVWILMLIIIEAVEPQTLRITMIYNGSQTRNICEGKGYD